MSMEHRDGLHEGASGMTEQQLLDHQEFLFTIALKITKDRHKAEDLVNETNLKARKNKEKFRENDSLKGRLRTIMKHLSINQYRIERKNKQRLHVIPLENDDMLSTGARNQGIDNLQAQEITALFEEINPDASQAFMLAMNGWKYQEIAEIQDIPLGTVRTRIFRTRKKLTEALLANGEYTLPKSTE